MTAQKQKRSKWRLRFAIVIALIFVWFFFGIFRYINEPNIQAKIFSSINKISSLKIESAKLNINFLKRKITVANLSLFNSKKDQRFTASRVAFTFKLSSILRGRLNIVDLDISDLKVDVLENIKKEGSEKISLSTLLLFKNLAITNGTIDRMIINFPQSHILVDRAGIDFTPSVFGDIRLKLRLLALKAERQGGSTVSVDEVNIDGATDVSNWLDVFPYVDDLGGNVGAKNITYEQWKLDTLDTKIKYSQKNLRLDSFTALINGHKLSIDGVANGKDEKYSLNINLSDPIFIPAIGGENAFVNTSGELSGRIHIDGQGFDYKKTLASADVSLKHILTGAEPLPAELTCKVNVSVGTISTTKANLKIGNSLVVVDGSFNYLRPNLILNFAGENVPIESVMSRFLNKHYHPARGVARASGTFYGWKPNLKFHLSVDASNGLYYEMRAEHAKMELDITYNDILLVGKIYQGATETASIDLKMKLGAMMRDGDRYKTFDLVATANHHDLTPTMESYKLRGTGNGSIRLNGTPDAFSGEGKLSIDSGDIKGISFDRAESTIKFSPKQIVFDGIAIAFSSSNSGLATGPLTMDILDNGIHLFGKPRPNISIDANYLSGNGQWNIRDIEYSSLEHPDWVSSLSGSLSASGGLDLKLTGTLDSLILTNYRSVFRDAAGPLELKNISITGSSNDPAMSGSLIFRNNDIRLRNWGYSIEKLTGTLNLSGHTINIPELSGRIEYGDFRLSGNLSHESLGISNVDLSFSGKSIMYALQNRTFKIELDCNLDLKGGPASSSLSGNVNILDGKYSKKFSIFEKLVETQPVLEEKSEDIFWKNTKLDLKVKSSGDLKIDNNIGEIWLNVDLNLGGTIDKPKFTGNINTVDGKISYAGLNFDVTNGFVEFRDPYTVPYVEFTSSKEVGSYNVTLMIRGPVDRLQLDLNSTPPLDRKDILGLLAFGMTEENIRSSKYGPQLSTGFAVGQVASMFQGPVTKYTSLDRFGVSTVSGAGSKETTRLYFGKDISDRLSVNFATDINTTSAQQMFQGEYLLTDNLLLKGAGTTGSTYRFDLTLRFKEQ